MYKIMHNFDKYDKCNRFQIINNQVRGHCFKYFKEISRQQHRENFFFNRTANLWNSLPSEIVQAPTVNSFKAGIDCWMRSNRSYRLSQCVLSTHSLALPVTATTTTTTNFKPILVIMESNTKHQLHMCQKVMEKLKDSTELCWKRKEACLQLPNWNNTCRAQLLLQPITYEIDRQVITKIFCNNLFKFL